MFRLTCISLVLYFSFFFFPIFFLVVHPWKLYNRETHFDVWARRSQREYFAYTNRYTTVKWKWKLLSRSCTTKEGKGKKNKDKEKIRRSLKRATLCQVHWPWQRVNPRLLSTWNLELWYIWLDLEWLIENNFLITCFNKTDLFFPLLRSLIPCCVSRTVVLQNMGKKLLHAYGSREAFSFVTVEDDDFRNWDRLYQFSPRFLSNLQSRFASCSFFVHPSKWCLCF